MKNLIFAGLVLFFISGCGGESGIDLTTNIDPPPNNTSTDDNTLPPVNLAFADGYYKNLGEIINGEDGALKTLVERVRGRVGAFRSGSIAVVGNDSETKLALYASANHVYGLSSWESYDEGHISVFSDKGIYLSSHIPSSEGNVEIWDTFNANFPLYHFTIPDGVSDTTIPPENDFYIGLLDAQSIPYSNLASYPEDLKLDQPPSLYDPQKALSFATWGNVESGSKVIALGYPQDKVSHPNGLVSVGSVLSDDESVELIKLLNSSGDDEGLIPYNPEVEFISTVYAEPGMSGGGVFNIKGQLVGIMVRATSINGITYTRSVRLQYIRNTFSEYALSLNEDDLFMLKKLVSPSFFTE